MIHGKLSIVIWVGLLLLTQSVSISVADDALPFSDEFNEPTLNQSWRFFDPWVGAGNPAALSSYALTESHLEISVTEGAEHDLWVHNALAPRLLQSVPNSDIGIEVKFDGLPTARIQMQGIIFQQDADTFLRLGTFHDGDSLHVFAAYIDGHSSNVFHSAASAGGIDPYYLRVIRTGDNWSYSYSEDGLNWTTAITFFQELGLTEVGVYGGNSGPSPAYTARVDFFRALDSANLFSDETSLAPPDIEFWYGDRQTFGHPGVPQLWVQLLGRVTDDNGVATLSYTLNSRTTNNLPIGPDGNRLVGEGDFNIEIPYSELVPGVNEIIVTATDNTGEVSTKTLLVTYEAGTAWPLPYSIDWSQVTQISDVAQVVDGLWSLTDDGIRVMDPGYDRLIAIGDERWPPNYEITFPITIYSAATGPGGGSGVGVVVGWQGHDGSAQPRRGWPLQALGWIANLHRSPELQIVTYPFAVQAQQDRPEITVGTRYMFKIRSEILGDGLSRVSMQVWPLDYPLPRPSDWDISADVPTRTGSILLLAHHVDVAFGNIEITIVDSK